MSRFGTKKFNLHLKREFPPLFELGDMKQNILIENTKSLYEDDLEGFVGICLDISHLENDRLLECSSYQQINSLLDKFTIGANHLSAITTTLRQYKDKSWGYESHHMSSLNNFDYLKRYPSKLFSEYAAIELNNPISEQIELISYLKRILKFF